MPLLMAESKELPAGTLVARWSLLGLLLAFGVVYVLMLVGGYGAADAAWVAGLSVVPLAVAILVGAWVWKYLWRLS